MDATSLDPRLRDAEELRSAMASGASRFATGSAAAGGGASSSSSSTAAAAAAAATAAVAVAEAEPRSPATTATATTTPSSTSSSSHQPAPSGHPLHPPGPAPAAAASSSFSPPSPASASADRQPTRAASAPRDPPPAADADGSGDPGDAKKARACESCRGLKVRCAPAPGDPEGPCKRCAKAGRACVVTQPTRKRQKKTDSRVAELEKKIDALTASLQASRGGGGGGGGAAVAAVTPTATSHGGPLSHHAESITNCSYERGGPYQLASLARGWSSDRAVPQPPAPRMQPSQPSHAAFDARMDHLKRYSTGGGGGGGGGGSSGGSSYNRPSPSSSASSYPPPSSSASYPPPMVMAGQKRKFAESNRESATACSDPEQPPSAAATPSQNHHQPQHSSAGRDYLDVIDKEILTMDKAAELFARYTDEMVPHLPAVVFPAGTRVAEVRRSRPTLFLAIMAVAASELPAIQRRLVKELMETIANKVIIVGEKSMELIQALQVAVIWYFPPEHFEELKFYQLVHLAAVIAIDIGLGRRCGARGGGFRKYIHSTWRHQHVRREPPPDPTSLEARRTWLVCYFLATNTSMALHRPNLVRWSAFMAECVDVLGSAPDAAPLDKYLCHLVWTHKLAEDVGVQFSLDDPASIPNLTDTRAQFALRAFERDLEKYRRSLPEDMMQPSLQMSFHVMSLYMHEIATQTEPPPSDDKPSDDLRDVLAPDTPLTPAHASALSSCLTAIDGVFEVFLSVDVAQIRCLPVFNFIRVAYAVVVLIKLYFAASSPRSELAKVVDKDDMKVQLHLDRLLEKFRAAAADDKSRPAAKLLIVLAMLRSWFQKQSQQQSASSADPRAAAAAATTHEDTCRVLHEAAEQYHQRNRDLFESPSDSTKNDSTNNNNTTQQQPQHHHQQQQQHPPEYSTANTPLQLLSEIATNDSAATPSTAGTAPPAPRPDFWMPRQAPQPFMYSPSQSAAAAAAAAAVASSSTATGASPGQGMMGPSPSSWTTASGSTGSANTNPGPANAGLASFMDPSFDFSSIGDAMNFTFSGMPDGLGAGYDNPIPYVIGDSPLMGNLMDGMGMMDTRWLGFHVLRDE